MTDEIQLDASLQGEKLSLTANVAVIGAGLVGCVAAMAFAKRGYNVTLFERREDPKFRADKKNNRSINLAISARGLHTLSTIDQSYGDKFLDMMIPMQGRMIHTLSGKQESQLYGLYGESINSIDRNALNEGLVDEVKKMGISVNYGYKLTHADLSKSGNRVICQFEHRKNGGGFDGEEEFNFDFIVGCDGAYSKVRYELQKYMPMNFSQEYIDMIYVELYLSPGLNENKFQFDANHLHIWPRDKFMLIALANKDGSFTLTFFGSSSLVEKLIAESKIIEFFKLNFKDVYEKIDDDDFILKCFQNKAIYRNSLLCIECNKYNYLDKAIILGDAAHAMVPFYGQGMNCGFEDVRILMDVLDRNHGNLLRAFNEYSQLRNKDLRAIIQLAKENYREMSSKVVSNTYLLRKKIDGLLGKCLGDKWLPLYTMISFRSDISYSKAIDTRTRQDKILNYVTGIVVLTGLVGSIGIGKKILNSFK